MDDKINEVVKILKEKIRGYIKVESKVPLVLAFEVNNYMPTIYISVDPVMVEKSDTITIALGVKANLQNYIHNLIFK